MPVQVLKIMIPSKTAETLLVEDAFMETNASICIRLSEKTTTKLALPLLRIIHLPKIARRHRIRSRNRQVAVLGRRCQLLGSDTLSLDDVFSYIADLPIK